MPQESANHSNLGFSLAVAGDWKSADQEARKALELDPDHANAKSLLDLANRSSKELSGWSLRR